MNNDHLTTAEQDALSELDDPFAQGEPNEDDEVAAIPLRNEPPFRITKGKYKGLVLPKMIGIKPSYYEKVEALKDEIVDDPEFQQYASSIARTYAELRREAETKAAELSEVKLRLAACMLLMIDQMEVEDESAVTLGNGDNIRVQPEPHLIIEDKEQFRQWCVAEGLERAMVLPWGTANKHVKEMLVRGEEHPPGTQCYVRPKVVFKRGEK
jgi:hypothetical protein